MTTPDFVVIGHVVRDLTPEGWRLGGTATFAAVQAQRLGLTVGVVTRAGPDLALSDALPGVQTAGRPADHTTSFENLYRDGRRRQRVPEQADALAAEDVPDAWRAAPISLIGPVCGEVPADLSDAIASPLIGVSAQGWLRHLDRERHVQRRAWTGDPFWSRAHVVFVSREDLADRAEQIDRWIDDVPIVIVTQDRGGARVHEDARWRTIAAFPAQEIDPTGAGDVFASAFLARYHETHDTARATRFAACAAACAIEGLGTAHIATRDQIETRMTQHEEIALR